MNPIQRAILYSLLFVLYLGIFVALSIGALLNSDGSLDRWYLILSSTILSATCFAMCIEGLRKLYRLKDLKRCILSIGIMYMILYVISLGPKDFLYFLFMPFLIALTPIFLIIYEWIFKSPAPCTRCIIPDDFEEHNPV